MGPEVRLGWIALGTAGGGLLLPLAGFLWAAIRYRDDLAWQEGLGFIVLVCCLAVVIVSQVSSLVIGVYSYAWAVHPGRIACAVALTILVLAVISIVILVGSLLRVR
jgi:hypothetical protein